MLLILFSSTLARVIYRRICTSKIRTFSHLNSAHLKSNKHPVPGISLPELLGDTHFFALKDPVEV